MKNDSDIQEAARKMAKAGASKGGVARAKSLTPEKRSEIARRAVAKRWERAGAPQIPQAFGVGDIVIGSHKIPCAVLETNEGPIRLITQEGFLHALGRARKAKGGQGASVVDDTPAFMAAQNLKAFIPEDIGGETIPIVFRVPSGVKAFGYRAELLPKVCEIFVEADRAGKVLPSQRHIAEKAYILLKGLARVGIAALIDEATGYQQVRDHNALQQILAKYLKDEWSKWTKRFPDSFYRELFRLKGIPYPPSDSGKKPQYVGHWTNDIVYSRLAPGLRAKLKELNPRTPSGNKSHKHHQFLTEDYGVPELSQHLHSVEALMRAAQDDKTFKIMLDRAFPKYGDTMPLENLDLE